MYSLTYTYRCYNAFLYCFSNFNLVLVYPYDEIVYSTTWVTFLYILTDIYIRFLLYSLSSNFLHARTTGADRGEYGQNSSRHDGCRESTERNGKMLWHLCAAMEKVRKTDRLDTILYYYNIRSPYKTAVACALVIYCVRLNLSFWDFIRCAFRNNCILGYLCTKDKHIS